MVYTKFSAILFFLILIIPYKCGCGTLLVFKIHQKKIKSGEYIEFLTQIMKYHPHRKVIVITDNASIHKSNLVREFIKSNEKIFAIYYLPTYSPELNPDEHVWAYLKAHKLVAHQAKNTEELKMLTKKKMRNIQKSPKRVSSFFMKSILT